MPRHADALYNLGVACAEDGQTERALFCYELTTHFNPNCAEAWNNLGVLHKEADNLERAAECYMAALNIRPNFPQVRAAGASSCTACSTWRPHTQPSPSSISRQQAWHRGRAWHRAVDVGLSCWSHCPAAEARTCV